MKKVAVLLSGCGVFDGSEIHESVMVLLALDRAGAQAVCTAPDIVQKDVIDHYNRRPVKTETRSLLIEAARIARGNITPITQLSVESIDAVILPGGMGVVKSLSNFAFSDDDVTVEPGVANFLTSVHKAGKPMGFICIAPSIAARLFGPEHVEFTIGTDEARGKSLEKWGAKHINCSVTDIVVDKRLKIVSTPAYMLAKRISEVEQGVSKLVQAVLELA